MTTSLVTPGTEIGTVGEHQAGEGTTTVDNRIVATTTGYMRIDDGQIIVDASKSIVNIEIGDTVLCQFEKLQEKGEKHESSPLKESRAMCCLINSKATFT